MDWTVCSSSAARFMLPDAATAAKVLRALLSITPSETRAPKVYDGEIASICDWPVLSIPAAPDGSIVERWSIRFRTLQALTLPALALAVAACGPVELADEGRSQGVGGRWCTIVFGAILPPIGGDAAPGTAVRFGYEAASEAVNSAGGVAVGAHRCLFDVRYAEAAELGSDLSSQLDHFATQLGVDFLVSAFPDVGSFAYCEPHGIPMLAGGNDALIPGRVDALCRNVGNGAAAAASDGSAQAACAAVLQLDLFQQAIEAAGRLDPEAVRRELLALGATGHERRD